MKIQVTLLAFVGTLVGGCTPILAAPAPEPAPAEAQLALATRGRALWDAFAKAAPEPPPPPDVAPPHIVPPVPDIDDPLGLVFGRSSPKSLIVATQAMEEGSADQLEEDLKVMSRILEKTLERQLGGRLVRSAMGIAVSSLGGDRLPQNLYIEGYGALFLLNVRFPLTPPPASEARPGETTKNTLWEETRKEMLGQTGPGMVWHEVHIGGDNAPSIEYSKERVEALQRELIQALGNATNIRNLKADDVVTIAVSGPSPRTSRQVHRVQVRSTGSSGGGAAVGWGGGGIGGSLDRGTMVSVDEREQAATRGATLTVSAQKADIDAFAKGEMDLAAFQAKAKVRLN